MTFKFEAKSELESRSAVSPSGGLHSCMWSPQHRFLRSGMRSREWVRVSKRDLPTQWGPRGGSVLEPPVGGGRRRTRGALGNGRTVGRVAGGRVTDVILKALIYDFFSLR